jgi:hypothetical protein
VTVTCLSCGAEYGQPHAANCQFRIAAPTAAPMRLLARILAAAALTGLAVTACAAPAAPTVDQRSPVPWATADTPTAAVDVQAPDGSIAGDGTYIVGGDVQPGTYKSAGPGDRPVGMCYWARHKDTTGDTDSIIANNIGKGPQVVTIKKTDGAFETRGCATWARAS